ncbi:acylphosphatase [Ketobacter alkanivorans]|uniref:Acylphosphatase n=1 Tax=Ketobacter alkanivorans TaxID=1917421 RepID=A0A2K9LSC6_9GAMM|nr:acylphosphatase [Ketobacter alkanivorans]AUM15031.1 hypothetical protein Kalk_19175 [Ketobacter alkanivorans]
MSESKRVNMIVEGTVQGVYFRASTREKALTLGLTGWVRNLRDGRVEFEAQGPAHAVEELVTWAKKGPEHAQVTQAKRIEIATLPGEQTFQITR